ncbi:hypothetical protein CAEBREN_20810 [Caenorhabditis brenneri]|uniref:Uncharacterized protein n=1 Tax=Caenorhabditis brenneri TaxID=135651 RepID=G0MES6_CAEBE|nr:hypothetical protein CAEBREN_20810 [Caenorhabditis brenneri]
MSANYELHPIKRELEFRIINGEEVRLIIDPEVNKPLECRNDCGQNGFCFERYCYQFPFEKYRIAYGSLVKNEIGELTKCDENCSGRGLYCRVNLFGNGICLSGGKKQ